MVVRAGTCCCPCCLLIVVVHVGCPFFCLVLVSLVPRCVHVAMASGDVFASTPVVKLGLFDRLAVGSVLHTKALSSCVACVSTLGNNQYTGRVGWWSVLLAKQEKVGKLLHTVTGTVEC